MNSHDAVVDAMLRALREPLAVADGPIDEDIDSGALPEDVQECINLFIEGSDPGRVVMRGHPVEWTTTVVVEHYARADGRGQHGASAGRRSRALFARAYARLMADPSLGGLCTDLLPPEVRSDKDLQDTRLGCLIATYRVQHRTQARTMEQWQ